jgi:hypothetical protein
MKSAEKDTPWSVFSVTSFQVVKLIREAWLYQREFGALSAEERIQRFPVYTTVPVPMSVTLLVIE